MDIQHPFVYRFIFVKKELNIFNIETEEKVMIESFVRNGKRTIMIDLSDRFSNHTRGFEPNAHKIIYKNHKDSMQ